MQNPFKKRATEFIEDPASFVSLTSPEPLKLFFGVDSTVLFDRLVTVVGTPGSGKTTLARLMDIETLFTLSRPTSQDAKNLASALASYQIIKNFQPQLLSYRLPSSSNLRDIWELRSYSEALRSALLRSFIQAKAILGWLRKLEKLEVCIADIQIITKEGSESQRNLIHADDPLEFRRYARSIEEEVLRVITSLLPPSEEELLGSILNTRFNAFEVIEAFMIPGGIPGLEACDLPLKPLVIIDDAHELHPTQFQDITAWLKSREMKIARWLITRVDAIAHDDFRKALVETDNNAAVPGTTLGRDHIFRLIQRERKDRKTFRRIARDISRQYIEQMPSFRRKGIATLADCLSNEPQQINKSDLNKLQDSVDQLIAEARFPSHQVEKIRDSVPSKLQTDQFLATYRILLNREKKRTPQKDLFGLASDSLGVNSIAESAEVSEDEEESKTAKSSLVRGAEIQLMHLYGRPFFYTFDRLADASGDNIEQFINLAGALVDGLETKLLRGKTPKLDAKEQHQLLTERATNTIREWDFPNSEAVRKLVLFIANKCIEKTMEPNASLDDGANAFGIPQSEMDDLQARAPALVSVLHFALAYNALTLLENYPCKNRMWCVFELGGLPNIVYRLTLNRGGFCEGHLSDLVECISE